MSAGEGGGEREANEKKTKKPKAKAPVATAGSASAKAAAAVVAGDADVRLANMEVQNCHVREHVIPPYPCWQTCLFVTLFTLMLATVFMLANRFVGETFLRFAENDGGDVRAAEGAPVRREAAGNQEEEEQQQPHGRAGSGGAPPSLVYQHGHVYEHDIACL